MNSCLNIRFGVFFFSNRGNYKPMWTETGTGSREPCSAGRLTGAKARVAAFFSASDELIKCVAAPAMASDARSTIAASTLTIASHCK